METVPVIEALGAAATLAAVEGELVVRHAAEARDLALAAHWADLDADPVRHAAALAGEKRRRYVGCPGQTPSARQVVAQVD